MSDRICQDDAGRADAREVVRRFWGDPKKRAADRTSYEAGAITEAQALGADSTMGGLE